MAITKIKDIEGVYEKTKEIAERFTINDCDERIANLDIEISNLQLEKEIVEKLKDDALKL